MSFSKDIPSRLIIEASAGSGKTYQLAQRYINLLGYSLKKVKNLEILPPEDLYSVIAITFTNKAAVEMKERILLFLKNLSGIYKDEKFNIDNFLPNKDEAFQLLVKIIKNHSDFYVTTIDSFMNKILKAFAIDLNINPDYDITFKEEDIFNFAFEEILADTKNKKNLLEFLEFSLQLDESLEGFNGEKIIAKSIKRFKNIDISEDRLTFEEFISIYNFSSLDEIQIEGEKILKRLIGFIENNLKTLNAGMVKTYKNLSDFSSAIYKIKNIKKLLDDGYNSKLFRKVATFEQKEEFLSIIKKLYALLKVYIIAKRILEVESVAEILRKFKEKENEIKSNLNIITGSDIAKKVNNILNSDIEVNYAFCRLGEKITHYLIDEFQDTSRLQYEAILPLIKNAVAEGGTLFVVGDKKQAIYGWRGGDYRLFKKIEEDFKPIVKDTIKTNFRSYRNIVEFNNHIFDKNILLKITSNFNIDELSEIYDKSFQDCNFQEDGYVKVILKDFTEIEDDFDEFYRENLIHILDELIFKKNVALKDILILLRSKKNIEKVVKWIREDFPEINFITEDSLDIIKNFEIKKFLVLISAIIYSFDNSYKEALNEIGVKLIDFEIFEKKAKELSPYEFFCYVLENCDVQYKENELYFNTLLEKVLELEEEQKTIEEICKYFLEDDTEVTVKISENLNAIKIMTIHKAKGLGSHTVIIPFYDWLIYDTSFINIIDEFPIDKDKKIFVRVKKELREILEEADRKYENEIKQRFIEALNLMYVANTRAIKNLFIIGAYKLTQKKEIPKQLRASHILKVILKEDVYEKGKILKEDKEGDIFNEGRQKAIEISSNIRDHLKLYPEVSEVNIDLKEKFLGDLFHLAISFVEKIDNKDEIENVSERVYNKAISFMNYENSKVKILIKNTLNDLKEFYLNVENSWNEKEIVDDEGNIYRLDRLVKNNGQFFIIEFKTGKELKTHEDQVKNYIKLFEKLKMKVIGLLYYPFSRKIKYVNRNN